MRHIDAADVGPFQAKFGPDTFVVLESWASPEALRDHAAAPHMKNYAQRTKDLVASRAIHILSAIEKDSGPAPRAALRSQGREGGAMTMRGEALQALSCVNSTFSCSKQKHPV
jgi:hypothetical protein